MSDPVVNQVIVDMNEPSSYATQAFWGESVEVYGDANLPSGDYVFDSVDEHGNRETLLIVERKEAGDFIHSLQDGRLFDQAARLTKYFPRAYVVVEGSPMSSGPAGPWGGNDWNLDSIYGAMLTLQQMGVWTTFTQASYTFAQTCLALTRRSYGDVTIRPPRGVVLYSQGEAVLQAFEGIGPKRAVEMMAHYGTAGNAISEITQGRLTAKGIGKATQKVFIETLGGKMKIERQGTLFEEPTSTKSNAAKLMSTEEINDLLF